MKIKAVDIARQLGISKATVSLALNGKSGVSLRNTGYDTKMQGRDGITALQYADKRKG